MLEQLRKALNALADLVESVAQGGYSDEELRDEMLRWEREDAEGRGGLAELAISALRYQLAQQGANGPIEQHAAREQALRRLEAALFPSADLGLIEVDPAPEFSQRFPSARAFRIGESQVIAEPEAEGWHISVSHRERFPTIEELRVAATLANGADTLWIPLPVPGGQGPVPSTVIHLFETPPGHSPD